MHLCSPLINLLLLFFLDALTAASSNNPAKTIITIDCGSTATSTALNGREWIGDIRPKVSSLLQIKGSSTASTVRRSSTSADQVPHKTARISPSQFSYAFRVTPGEKILRLHFNPAPYKGFKRFNDLFNVEAGYFTLLSNFSASLTAAALGVNTFIKEFCISVEENQILTITFSPVTSQSGDKTYAFINGIEIIPVPLHLSYFKGGDLTAQVVGQKSLVYIDNSTALELIHRVNIKLDSVPLSDEFDEMLGTWAAFPKRKENEISSLTWKTPVDVGFRYLMRIHFSDLGLHLAETRGMSLRVLVNEIIVDANISIVQDEYGILHYRDYVVAVKGRKLEGKRHLLISLQSYHEFVDGHQLVKGFEIFKLSNPDNSLDSPNAFPPQTDSPSPIIKNLLKILCSRNATATLVITILALINIIAHKLREFSEATITEEIRPSARAERLCRRFSLAQIQSATNNFSEALLIGRGGFGKVYKGLIDNGRQNVAVKRLKSNSTQGKHEFLTEIETLSELRHINLVSLIGYCNDRAEMILVYEYMPSGTLADHLYKLSKAGNNSTSLTWRQRLNICIGAGRGLDYLHTGHGVIHRDVKASNILLDENFVAKVSDFGLAKLEDRSKLQSHVSTKVKGTYGYLDPYYFSTRKLTRKSDTYAFGVVLLEVLCERQAMDPRFGEEEYCLTRWARNKINEGEVNQIVASSLMEDIVPDSLNVFVEVAERCLHDEPKKRPTMAQVVLQLESALELQESRKIAEPNQIALVANNVPPSNEDQMTSVNTEQSEEAPTYVNTVASPPTDPAGEKDVREPKPYKRLRFWAWDAFWNRLKPSKRKEFSLIPEIGEPYIRLPTFDLSWSAAATNQFLFADLVAATNDFSWENKIGTGSFGVVYKGRLADGREVAIKRSETGTKAQKFQKKESEFYSELAFLSRLHHKHLIRLVGYCEERDERLLVYEYMNNGALYDHLHSESNVQKTSSVVNSWKMRIKISLDAAHGIEYLHNYAVPPIIHRDIKSSNILLDANWTARVSDFGISLMGPEHDHNYWLSKAVGTVGYIDPEFYGLNVLTAKSDVYSLGVVLLELLTGKRAIFKSGENGGEPISVVDYTVPAIMAGEVGKILDPRVGPPEASESLAIELVAYTATDCVQLEGKDRPKIDCIVANLERALALCLCEDISSGPNSIVSD